jgi:nicotinamide mononucleotide adenylyltransferase
MGLREVHIKEQLPEDLLTEASVHGRFQVLHNDHLEYILAAKKRCRYLWIGITKYDIDHLNPLGRHRERPEANPLTYFERIQIIKEALVDAGIHPAEFSFVPFPIENPTLLTRFLPNNIPCFTTICEDWNREKIQLLKDYGYTVLVLWEREPKKISGSRIREDIAAGGTMWRDLVPAATARAVKKLALAARIRSLLDKSEKR